MSEWEEKGGHRWHAEPKRSECVQFAVFPNLMSWEFIW